MRTLSRKSFAIGLLVALLVIFTGRVVPVSAMADPTVPIEDVAPVYDTVIIQLQDYVENDLTEPQYEIFALLWGLYTNALAGAEDYKLANPYESQDGVLNWLKGLGVDAYNTLISLAPDTITMPDGSFLNTVPIKEKLSDTIAIAMGMAVTASQYEDVDDFMDDVDDDNRSHYWIPFSDVTMYGMNSIFETYGGIYGWQFKTQPFSSNTVYNSYNGSNAILIQERDAYLSEHGTIRVRFNHPMYSPTYVGCLATGGFLETYTNLFVNTTDHRIYLCTDAGVRLDSSSPAKIVYESHINSTNNRVYSSSVNDYPFIGHDYSQSFNPGSYDTYVDLVKDLYNHVGFSSNNPYYWFYFEDFVKHVYVGDSWVNRHEIYNVQDHNLTESDQPYYLSPDTQSQFYMDIKGMLQDLVNNTNLMNVFLHNIYTPDGVLVHDTDLIRVSLRLLQDYEQQNPPIPVNLNDISDYTDNTFLDRIKEEALRGGSALAYLVAFWHNCDPDLVYVLFGAGITVLVGAFIGKWGHS